MKFTYDGTEYDMIDPDRWSTLDALKVQEATGRKVAEVILDLKELGPLGVHAFAWVSLRRAGVDMAWGDLDLPWIGTLHSMNGDAVQEAPDPSTASTRQPRKAGGRVQPAQSAKK